jgi:hypothetical protein
MIHPDFDYLAIARAQHLLNRIGEGGAMDWEESTGATMSRHLRKEAGANQ